MTKKKGLALASPETRKRVSALGGKQSKGKPKSKEHRRKLSESYWKNQQKDKNT